MDLGLRDRVYVLTGATGGLGFATAQALVSDGAKVVVSSRTQASVDAAVARLGSDAIGLVADNADPDTVDRLIQQAKDSFGRIDGALISVGGPAAGPVMDATEDQWRSAFDSVFLGAVRLATGIAQALGEGGSIALVLSTSAKSPIPDLAISNGLRPGLAMVAKQLADELGPRGVRVNTLLPGRIDTDRVQWLDEQTGDAAAARAANEKAIPLGRYGDPAEFGAAAAFLLSPAAGFVNGVALPVDGGLTRAL